LRQCFNNMPTNLRKKILFILVDTSPMITKVDPTQDLDPYRRSMRRPSKLLPPFYLITSIDCLSIKQEQCRVVQLIQLGRPLWAALYESMLNTWASQTAIQKFAQVKLMCGCDDWEWVPESEHPLVSVAVLSSLVTIRVRDSSMACSLIAGYMGTCTAISKDREKIIVHYPSEPILAQAALNLLWKNFNTFLNHLCNLIQWGSVDRGYPGEIVCQLVLLLAIHSDPLSKPLSPDSTPTPTPTSFRLDSDLGKQISLMQYLSHLLPQLLLDRMTLSLPISLLEGTVGFNHFIQLEYSLPKEQDRMKTLLKQLHHRYAAASVPHNEADTDVVIPVHLQNGRFMCLMVQVKNQNSFDNRTLKEAMTQLSQNHFLNNVGGMGLVVNSSKVHTGSSQQLPVVAKLCQMEEIPEDYYDDVPATEQEKKSDQTKQTRPIPIMEVISQIYEKTTTFSL